MGLHIHEKVLVVDDDPLFRMMLRQFLVKNGFEVVEAENGHEAIQRFEQTSPDIVLMDALMPVMDGMTACKKICDSQVGKDCAVLMVTSKDDDVFIKAAFDAGAADYITKPIQWMVLKQRIIHRLKEHRALLALQESEERFRSLFHESPLPYQSLDVDGHIIEVNKAWLAMLDYQENQVEGRAFTDFLLAEDKAEFVNHFTLFKQRRRLLNMHCQMLSQAGAVIDVEMNGRVATDLDGDFKKTHTILQDITERKTVEAELVKLATTDPLTGLKNRRAFFSESNILYVHSIRYNHPFSVMMLDIDHFKAINDRFGHDIGDIVLLQVAKCILSSLREVDIVARLGGEEFGVVLPETSLASAVEAAERIRSAIEGLKVTTVKGLVEVTISIGVTMLSADGESVENILKKADALLYQAKKQGRNRVEK